MLRILWRPGDAWAAVLAADPDWRRSLGVVGPLALLPAIAWPLGHALDPIGPGAAALHSLAASFAATFAFCVAAVFLAAAVIYALAPLFEARRHWNRAMAVAAYSSVPVLLAAPLLFSATLTILVIAAFFHACVLCALGLERLLGCRNEDAAMYVAAVGLVSGVAGLLLGGLSSAAGIL